MLAPFPASWCLTHPGPTVGSSKNPHDPGDAAPNYFSSFWRFKLDFSYRPTRVVSLDEGPAALVGTGTVSR